MAADTTYIVVGLKKGAIAARHVVQVVHDTVFVAPPPAINVQPAPVTIETSAPESIFLRVIGPAVGALIGGLFATFVAVWVARRKDRVDERRADSAIRHRVALVADDLGTMIHGFVVAIDDGGQPNIEQWAQFDRAVERLNELAGDFHEIRDRQLFTDLVLWHMAIRHAKRDLTEYIGIMQPLRALTMMAETKQISAGEDKRREALLGRSKTARGHLMSKVRTARGFGMTVDVFEQVSSDALVFLTRPATDPVHFPGGKAPWWLRPWFALYRWLQLRQKPSGTRDVDPSGDDSVSPTH